MTMCVLQIDSIFFNSIVISNEMHKLLIQCVAVETVAASSALSIQDHVSESYAVEALRHSVYLRGC